VLVPEDAKSVQLGLQERWENPIEQVSVNPLSRQS
jgi:hypothetical protein